MRSLILAGGGYKVGYQAGCLQVLLDEAGLTFDHVDAASGGCFNAAMMASGMSGTQIADHWRAMDARDFTTLNWGQFLRGPWMRSIGTSEGLRRIFKQDWKLDWDRIHACTAPVFTFNHFNFTQKRVVVVTNRELDEDHLVASTSIVVWFPPVSKGNDWLLDAVYCMDSNVGEAVRRGADEMWAIWTVSDTPEFRDGWIAQYFHIIETVSDAKFKADWSEIEAVNKAIETFGPTTGRSPAELQYQSGFDPNDPPPPPPGRKTIAQNLIQQEVPVHYSLNFSRDRMAATVEMGVRDTRKYMQAKFPATNLQRIWSVSDRAVPLFFSETMRGYFMPGASNCIAGESDGRKAGNRLEARLTIRIANLDSFISDPKHKADVTGEVWCPSLRDEPIKIGAGTFKQFVNERSPGIIKRNLPGRKRMIYDLRFEADEKRYRLKGKKYMRYGTGVYTVWPDTTTLHTQLFVDSGGGWQSYGIGMLHVTLFGFLFKELPSFLILNQPLLKRVRTLARYAQFFSRHLWDVYLRGILDYAPF